MELLDDPHADVAEADHDDVTAPRAGALRGAGEAGAHRGVDDHRGDERDDRDPDEGDQRLDRAGHGRDVGVGVGGARGVEHRQVDRVAPREAGERRERDGAEHEERQQPEGRAGQRAGHRGPRPAPHQRQHPSPRGPARADEATLAVPGDAGEHQVGDGLAGGQQLRCAAVGAPGEARHHRRRPHVRAVGDDHGVAGQVDALVGPGADRRGDERRRGGRRHRQHGGRRQQHPDPTRERRRVEPDDEAHRRRELLDPQRAVDVDDVLAVHERHARRAPDVDGAEGLVVGLRHLHDLDPGDRPQPVDDRAPGCGQDDDVGGPATRLPQQRLDHPQGEHVLAADHEPFPEPPEGHGRGP